LANFGNEISQIAQGLGKNTTTVDQLIAKATSYHLDVLAEVYEKVPEKAKISIEIAINKSTRARETAVKALRNRGITENISEEFSESVEEAISEIPETHKVHNETEAEIPEVSEISETHKGQMGKP
jgi:DNA-directed RNA polymerase specialized sigma24 family protein